MSIYSIVTSCYWFRVYNIMKANHASSLTFAGLHAIPYSQDPPQDFVSELGMRVGLCVQLLYGLPVCKKESCELYTTAVNLRPQLS